MPVTVRNTDILFNDGTTQSTAAVGVPAHLGVGSQITAYNFGTSNLLPGDTVAGSSLLRVTGGSYDPSSPTSGTIWLEGGGTVAAAPFLRMFGQRGGNVGAFQPSNTATLTGTWRALNHARARGVSYDPYNPATAVNYPGVAVVRIS